MEKTPKSMRIQIGLFGRTNVGKSTFLNLIAGQDVAITSPVPGTTTDVVEKVMEWLPLGPVVFLDTAGLDDETELGAQRRVRAERVFDRADIAILIAEPNVWTDHEERILSEARRRACPCVVMISKTDRAEPTRAFLDRLRSKDGVRVVSGSCTDPRDRERVIRDVKAAVGEALQSDAFAAPPLLGDLVPPGGMVVLIVPVDTGAPKGRLILPQVQAIRDALDHRAVTLVTTDEDYQTALGRLAKKPDLVICDSQVVDRMVTETPPDVPCTTFSILFARLKGDLEVEAAGAAAIERLGPNDRVLVAEACSHHPQKDDIGRVKIPRWLRSFAKSDIRIDVCAGRDYPDSLDSYSLIIHCGACMLTRREMLARLRRACEAGVPVTNYGVAISRLQNVLERVLTPFPAALDAYKNNPTPSWASITAPQQPRRTAS